MTEAREITIRRLTMRSMRRGIKEMDLILPAFARTALPGMSDADLTLYETLLSENDHDLYAWVTGMAAAPRKYGVLIESITQTAIGEVAGRSSF
jgi:antitoxin CptB